MTDSEIVKALELESTPMERNCIHSEYEEACGIWCAKKHKLAENCAECEEHKLGYYGALAAAALALINRQKAEIERLSKEVDRLSQLVICKVSVEDVEKHLKEVVGDGV